MLKIWSRSLKLKKVGGEELNLFTIFIYFKGNIHKNVAWKSNSKCKLLVLLGYFYLFMAQLYLYTGRNILQVWPEYYEKVICSFSYITMHQHAKNKIVCNFSQPWPKMYCGVQSASFAWFGSMQLLTISKTGISHEGKVFQHNFRHSVRI